MKKILFSAVCAMFAISMMAQTISVAEPEFVHSYIHVTSDTTFLALPKEHGEFRKHESGLSKFARIGGAVADVAGTVGIGMTGLGTSVGTVMTGVKTVETAMTVSSAVGTLDMLAGMEGMDIVFDGKESPYVVGNNAPMNIIVREADNSTDPYEVMRVVKFKAGKKDRKIRWMNIRTSLLGDKKSTKNGYLSFEARKYGESSYLITIPSEQLEKGEYGIIIGNAATATVIPVATFCVR